MRGGLDSSFMRWRREAVIVLDRIIVSCTSHKAWARRLLTVAYTYGYIAGIKAARAADPAGE